MFIASKTKKIIIAALLFLAIANPSNIQAIRFLPLGGACVTGYFSCALAALSVMSCQLLNLPDTSKERQEAYFETIPKPAQNTIRHFLSAQGKKYANASVAERIQAIKNHQGDIKGLIILYLISLIPFSYATHKLTKKAFAEEQQEKVS